jgi:very-short-patch-repair endonuclease
MGNKPITTLKFIERAKKVHGNKYIYDKVNYVNAHTKVIITCREHGDFEQLADAHIRGTGCKKCYLINNKNKTLTTKEFIKRARQIHGLKYDYFKTNYIDHDTKVIITCGEHGDFKQTPTSHLMGCGCQKCGKINNFINLKHTTKDFIKKAKLVHNNKYDYSKTEYPSNNKSKTIIICPEHGEFLQSPVSHIFNKSGCPICKESKGEKIIHKILLENNISHIRQAKFSDCKGKKNNLPFDFYLPQYNLIIEFDGKQHREPTGFGSGDPITTFNEIQFNDAIKNRYCCNNGIRLIRIQNKNEINKILSGLFSQIELKQV